MHFVKYQGAGNDFIMLDRISGDSESSPELTVRTIAAICDRRKGVGADGVIVIKPDKIYDFEMVYYNCDGREGTMCGNGGRCAVAYARELGVIPRDYCSFMACDGVHFATIGKSSRVNLKMIDVETIVAYNGVFEGTTDINGHYFLNTGSPHHVCFVKDLDYFDVEKFGSIIRDHPHYKDINGSNVNFVADHCDLPKELYVRTYERGVEHETFACGTGAVASAIVAEYIGFAPVVISEDEPLEPKEEDNNYIIKSDDEDIDTVLSSSCSPVNRTKKANLGPTNLSKKTAQSTVQTRGGTLTVTWKKNPDDHLCSDVYLEGPATKVFEGEYVI